MSEPGVTGATLATGATFVLAPMAGVTEWPMRVLCWEQGCAYAVTEMVSAKGCLHAPRGSRALCALLERDAREGPVALQLFGSEPSVIAEAIQRLSVEGFCAVDLNMGCPAPKIVRAGEGSALLRQPLLAARIVRAAVKVSAVPVSVKMRIGWDEESVCAVPFARMLEEEGACRLTVHGRTRAQFYSGKADLDQIAQVKASVRIPVWGNGDVFCATDAQRMIERTGCDGVMIGRGALGNPWVFAELRAHWAGQSYAPPGPKERVAMALRHAAMQCAWKGEAVAIREMRKHVSWYMHGLHGAAKLRARVHQAQTYAQLEAVLQEASTQEALPQEALLEQMPL